MDDKTLVYLDSFQAGQFVAFQKYFVPFSILLSSDFFREIPETLVVSKKTGGVIKSVVRTELTYSDNPNFIFIA